MTLNVETLEKALNAHAEWMGNRLHPCLGQGCAASIAFAYAQITQKKRLAKGKCATSHEPPDSDSRLPAMSDLTQTMATIVGPLAQPSELREPPTGEAIKAAFPHRFGIPRPAPKPGKKR